ncbi:MAG: hypothetical protein ACJA2M_002326 [Polaribacter sp.]|jgi:hypothetical protein
MKKTTFLLLTFITASFFGQVKLTSSLSEYEDGGVWKKSSKTEYSYDDNGNVTVETYLSWDSTSSQWLPLDKSSYTYNADNKATVVLNEYLGSDSEQFRTNYTYNTNGDLILMLDEDWNGSAWVNSYKFDLTYTNNRLSGGTSYDWNGTDWGFGDDAYKLTINYNANGTISSFNSYAWDETNWVSSDRTIFSYNGSNNLILQDGQTWNGTAWMSDYKSEYSYDTNGNLIEEKESYLESGSFVTGYEQTATFNTAELMSSYINPFKDKTGIDYLTEPNGIVNKILSKTGGNYDRTTYNYGDTTANVNNFSLVNFALYPNPATSVLNIDDNNFTIKNIDIYNVLGEKIGTSIKSLINIEKLVNGVYVVKVQDDKGNIATKRFVKN